MRILVLPTVFALLLLTGCSGLPVASDTAATTRPGAAPLRDLPAAPDDNLNAVVWQQTAIERELIDLQTWRAATAVLDRALAAPDWDALTREDRDVPALGLPPAVVVDVDETVLDNMAYEARLVRDRAQYDEFGWAQWAREEKATAVPGALEFAKAAQARGIVVYYISNRAEDLDGPTFDNLRRLGFPIANRSQFLGLGTVLPGCEEVGTEKTCRRRLVGRSHRVLVQVGDQIVDMVTVLSNTRDGRRDAVAPYLGWLGERWFVLPNPTYGGWEPALFDNDWHQPVQRRRERKIQALDMADEGN
jgi:acid phosphatase